jgi:hypothetical protein
MGFWLMKYTFVLQFFPSSLILVACMLKEGLMEDHCLYPAGSTVFLGLFADSKRVFSMEDSFLAKYFQKLLILAMLGQNEIGLKF